MEHSTEPLLREVVGHLLRCERHRQGRTLAQIATASGVSMQHLSDVERGRKDPSSEILAAVAGALGLTMHELLRDIAAWAPDAPVAAEAPVPLDLSSSGRGGRQGHLRAADGVASAQPQRPASASVALLAAA